MSYQDSSRVSTAHEVRRVALRFIAANAVGWVAFMGVVLTGGALPFLAVPAVCVVSTAWAAGAVTDRIAGRIGFGCAAALGLAGAMFAMLGTPDLTGEGSVLTFLPIVAKIGIIDVVAAAIGLLPLGEGLGARAWLFGVAGFAAGAIVGGLFTIITFLVPALMMPPFGYLLAAPFGVPMWLPSTAGGVAVAAAARSRRAAAGE